MRLIIFALFALLFNANTAIADRGFTPSCGSWHSFMKASSTKPPVRCVLPGAVDIGLASVRVAPVREVVHSFKAINATGAALLPVEGEGVFPHRANRRFLGGQRLNLATKGTACLVFVSHR